MKTLIIFLIYRLMLACFVALNYVKVVVLDDRLTLLHCFIERQDQSIIQANVQANLTVPFLTPVVGDYSVGRSLGVVVTLTSQELCREYLLSYTVFCVYVLTLYLVIILIFSEIYMRRLLNKVIDKEIDLEWKEEEDLEQQEQDDKDEEKNYLAELEDIRDRHDDRKVRISSHLILITQLFTKKS